MTMKKMVLLLTCVLVGMTATWAQGVTKADTLRHQVMLQTTKGDIVVELYNETPRHRDNFLKVVRSGYYNGILFHRVIADFMIQAGDSTTRHAKPGAQLGDYDLGYTVPAEFRFPQFFHRRGALAAAREPDSVNPQRASGGAHFYIVWGRTYSDASLDRIQHKTDSLTKSNLTFTPEIREYYKTVGGTPHLDGMYTVFGQVIKGLDVVDAIDHVATDEHDRPLDDVRIIKATVIK